MNRVRFQPSDYICRSPRILVHMTCGGCLVYVRGSVPISSISFQSFLKTAVVRLYNCRPCTICSL